MRTLLVIILLLLVGFAACKPASQDQRAATLVREANELLAQGSKSTEEWTSEYRAFTPQTRAQFPANRDKLRTSADKIVKALDENSRLSNSAIEKYEQALPLISSEQQRRGMTLLLSAVKKGVQVNELHKSQMQLVSDETIVDEKTFNKRFLDVLEQISLLGREIKAEVNEGRQLLGM